MKDKILIYHKNCPDGYGSRWVFEKKYGDDMDYIPMSHGEVPPDLSGKEVWIADFSFPRDILLDMRFKAKSLILIDHHLSAERNLKDLDFCHIDMSHCGAVLSWYYCNGINSSVPLLLQYIEDQDLWKWQMPFAKEIVAVIDSYDYSARHWDEIQKRLEDSIGFSSLLNEGSALLRYRDKKISEIIAKKHRIKIGDHVIWSCNSSIYQSQICDILLGLEGEDITSCYYFDGSDYIFSLRSKKDGGPDVSLIAGSYGGGGHKNASGMKLKKLDILNEDEIKQS
jgi:oligoribonuclease NrnB/cAMP/cGMP phosphodiesterase (DHH superfamily)